MKIRKRRNSRSTERKQAQEEGPVAGSRPGADKPPAAPRTIRKGIYLSALIYVEGEQAPAENFDPVAIGALRDALSSALKEGRDGLSMTLKGIDVRNDVEQEDEEEVGEKEGEEAKAKEEKFQF